MMIDKASTFIEIHEISVLMVTSGGGRVEYRSYIQLNSLNIGVM
jgi:hypothetical protein